MFIVWNRLNWSSMPLKSLWKRLFFQGKIQRVNAFYKILGMAPGWTRSPRWWQQQEPKDNKNNKHNKRRQREFRNSQLWRNLKTVFTVQKEHSEDQEPCRWCHTSEQHRISFWFLHHCPEISMSSARITSMVAMCFLRAVEKSPNSSFPSFGRPQAMRSDLFLVMEGSGFQHPDCL